MVYQIVKIFPAHYRFQRFTTKFASWPVLSQINPVHAQSCFLKAHLNSILPSTRRSLSVRFTHQNDRVNYYYFSHYNYPNTLHTTKTLASSWSSNIRRHVVSSPWLQFCTDFLPLLPALRAPCISPYLVWSLIVSVRARKLWSLSLCSLLHPLVTSSAIVANIPRLAV